MFGELFSSNWSLSKGGRVVAEAMGGRLISRNTRDKNEQLVINVVDEMAIATGISAPPVYLIDSSSINAFAAGHSLDDAVIGINRGTIEQLNRNELQGVIAHEFSHICHGDVRINMRLTAILGGILIIGIIGRYMLYESLFSARRHNRQSRGQNIALGVGLVVVGYAGILFW